jgi:hypothetical protein
MHALEDMKQLGSVENRLLAAQQPNESDSIEKLYAVDEFSQEVDIVLISIRANELHHKWRGDSRQSLPLVDKVLFQFGLNGLLLRNALESKEVFFCQIAD